MKRLPPQKWTNNSLEQRCSFKLIINFSSNRRKLAKFGHGSKHSTRIGYNNFSRMAIFYNATLLVGVMEMKYLNVAFE